MFKDFVAALKAKYNCNSCEELSGMELQHYKFAESTNIRGKDTISVFEALGFNLEGLKILDIGCAYGGFSIEAAHKGAICYGIELSEHLYRFACLNGKNEVYEKGNCIFKLIDATSTEFLDALPHDYFDIIIVNDVFEHVYDTVQLLKNISCVSNSTSVLYFRIPNGNDIRFIPKEGHSGYCGISIIRPLCWNYLTQDESWNIYYRQYDYYCALFQFYGFDDIIPINYPDKLYTDKNVIVKDYEDAKITVEEKICALPSKYVKELRIALKNYDSQMKYDEKNIDVLQLAWKYYTKFWCGFAFRQKMSLNPKTETEEFKSNSDRPDDIHFKMVINRNVLFVELTGGGLCLADEFAFNLIKDETIFRSDHQNEPCYQWKLSNQGMYRVAIYLFNNSEENYKYRILTQPLYYMGKEC